MCRLAFSVELSAAAMRSRVLAADLRADAANGIAWVLTRAEIERAGASPDAEFVIEFAPGYYAGAALQGEVRTRASSEGTHGYFAGAAGDARLLLYERPAHRGARSRHHRHAADRPDVRGRARAAACALAACFNSPRHAIESHEVIAMWPTVRRGS